MKEIILERDGSILLDDKRITLSDFEILFKEEPFGILDSTFDENESCFIITVLTENGEVTCKLKLSPEHEALLKNGIIDKDVQKLLDLTKAKKYQRKMREIDSKLIKDGELPNDYTAIQEYKEYLEKQIMETKASITRNKRHCFVMYLIAGLPPALVATLFILFGSVGFLALPLLYVGIPVGINIIESGDEIKKQKEELISYEDKVEKVNGKLAELCLANKKASKNDNTDNYNYPVKAKEEKVEQPKIAVPDTSSELEQETVEEREARKIVEYKLEFFDAFSKVIELVSKLPKKDQKEFKSRLRELFEEYLNRINLLMTNEYKVKNFSYGASEYILSLNYEMMGKVRSLENDVRRILVNNESLGEVQRTKDLIDSLSEEKGYVDGYTEGYTEGYGASGVAYAGKKVAR